MNAISERDRAARKSARLAASAILESRTEERIAAGLAALIYVMTRNLFAAMVGGVLAAYLSRLLLAH